MAHQFKQIMLIISKIGSASFQSRFATIRGSIRLLVGNQLIFFFGLLVATSAMYMALFKRNWASCQLLEAQNPANSELDILMVRWSFVGLEVKCHIN